MLIRRYTCDGKEGRPLSLDEADRAFLQRAIDISRHALLAEGKTPFGAVVVTAGDIVGEGTSQVVELCDPTAHAEMMALRAASSALGRHLIADGVVYCSSEPCPMCLAACYWARIPRVVYAATSHDVATYGFEDLRFYREFTKPVSERLIVEQASGQDQRDEAVKGLREWTEKLSFPVEPKY
jgi:tRNA(Arg) A34 adenosine deaminase TadA